MFAMDLIEKDLALADGYGFHRDRLELVCELWIP